MFDVLEHCDRNIKIDGRKCDRSLKIMQFNDICNNNNNNESFYLAIGKTLVSYKSL